MPFQKGNKYGNRFRPGESGNPNGQPRKLKTTFLKIPRDAREKLYGVLYHAISLGSVDEAKAYLTEQQENGGAKYGIVLEVAVKALSGPNGWLALNDIYDRLFGRPKQSVESSGAVTVEYVIGSAEEREKLENIAEGQ